MVDIQDARWGPDSYDLASLLRDAYSDIEETWVEPPIERYLAGIGIPEDVPAFRRRFDVVAAQRMVKALGTFGYLVSVRRNLVYVPAVRRTVARLGRVLEAREATAALHAVLGAAGVLEPPPGLRGVP
jgi:aminoglycoside/choline kinase family phosphotransferase